MHVMLEMIQIAGKTLEATISIELHYHSYNNYKNHVVFHYISGARYKVVVNKTTKKAIAVMER